MGIPVLKQTTAYRVEKGVPCPQRSSGGRPSKYPFGEMEIGDSFHFIGEAATLRTAVTHYSSRHHKKFSVCRDGDGWRCWRVS